MKMTIEKWLVVLVALAVSIFFSNGVFADEKIVKIGENNVEISVSYTVTDINGVEFEVWGEPDSYGQEKIDQELIQVNQETTDAYNFDEKAYKQKFKDNAKERLDRLKKIQTVMDE